MSGPTTIGSGSLSPSTYSPPDPVLQRPKADNLLAAPTTPTYRLPHVDRSKADPNSVKAAEGMEAMFIDYMMKTMRDSIPKNDMDLESPATGIYRGMLDSEYSQKAAHAGGVGLADQIIAYLEAQRYTLPRGRNPAIPPSGAQGKALTQDPATQSRPTGGTHEGQSVE